MKNTTHNKITRQKLTFIILAITTVLVGVLLAVMLVTHKPPELTRIEIVSSPYKTQYIEKQTLDTTGLVVKAYFGSESKEITNYSVDKSVLELGDETVTVSYTDNKITQTAQFSIDVVQKSLSYIEVTKQPDKTVYLENSLFDPSGIEVTAHYDNGESVIINGWEHNAIDPLSLSDNTVTISFGGNTANIPITVEQKRLQDIYLDRLPNKLKYTESEYFDFLGLELYAKYDNAPDERVYDWTLDVTRPLTTEDTNVNISYRLHDVTKSVTIDIEVTAAEQVTEEQKLLSNLIDLLPNADDLGVENLGALNYVISVLNATEITEEQQRLRDELTTKRDEIMAGIPEEPEREYNIEYKISDGLVFGDISYGYNPAKIKADQSITLEPAVSDIAVSLGYEFTGWMMDGKTVTSINNIDSDKTVYAVFTLTPAVEVIFKDKITDAVLWTADPLRTDDYNFENANIHSAILNKNGVLPVAYYSTGNVRIDSVNLNSGSNVIVYALTTEVRQLHLPDENLFTVGWQYEFNVDEAADQTTTFARTGSVFYIPIGAEVTITATNANIDTIVLDGKDIGTKLNATVVKAVFNMAEGEYAASLTYTTKLTDMTTLSFVGQNVQSVVYPVGWNGIMAEVDLKNLAFIFDEENDAYMNVYTIGGNEYYFDDLTSYVFGGDTVITVAKKRNEFTLIVKYANGNEIMDGLVGKQALRSALSVYADDALVTLKSIFENGDLFADETKTTPIDKDELLSHIVRNNITVYSDWHLDPEEPDIPTFEPVDYGEYSFVGTWSSLFAADTDILSCELVLTDDGNYSYKTYVNGILSADACGVYRLSNGVIEIKTFDTAYKYDIFTKNDLSVDIRFCADGLLRVEFVWLNDTIKTVFEQVLFCGEVRPVNYSAMSAVGVYDIAGNMLTLFENGTATIIIGDSEITAYYRIDEEGRVYLMENGTVGTGDITELLEESDHE